MRLLSQGDESNALVLMTLMATRHETNWEATYKTGPRAGVDSFLLATMLQHRQVVDRLLHQTLGSMTAAEATKPNPDGSPALFMSPLLYLLVDREQTREDAIMAVLEECTRNPSVFLTPVNVIAGSPTPTGKAAEYLLSVRALRKAPQATRLQNKVLAILKTFPPFAQPTPAAGAVSGASAASGSAASSSAAASAAALTPWPGLTAGPRPQGEQGQMRLLRHAALMEPYFDALAFL